MNEVEWRHVFDGTYIVSFDGRVRRSAPDRMGRTYSIGRDLGQCLLSSGYLQVAFSVAGKVKKHCAHTLVALAFIGDPPDGNEINHKNGIKTDNRIENLEYVTKSGNMKHAYDNGLVPKLKPILDYNGEHWTQKNPDGVRGENNGKSKLTVADVLEIRKAHEESKLTMNAMSQQYSVSIGCIAAIVYRQNWRHIP